MSRLALAFSLLAVGCGARQSSDATDAAAVDAAEVGTTDAGSDACVEVGSRPSDCGRLAGSPCNADEICILEIGGVGGLGGGMFCKKVPLRCAGDRTCSCLVDCLCPRETCADVSKGYVMTCDNGVR